MHQFSYRWKSPNAQLEQALDAARSEIIRLRDQLRAKQTALGGLELALQARHQTIDQLNARLEQARVQCQRLDAEAEHYFQMLAAS